MVFLLICYLLQLSELKFTLPLELVKVSDQQQTQFLAHHSELPHLRNQTTLPNASQDLQNYYNLQYTGTIKLLHNHTIISYKVIFDTGSYYLWLPSTECQGCPEATQRLSCLNMEIERNNSDTCLYLENLVNITYTVGSLTGRSAEGSFSLNDHFELMPFILVDYIQGMEGAMYEGIMGLGNHSLIQWPVSFYLSFGDEQSQITFGGFQKSLFGEDEISYFNAGDQWEIGVDHFKMQSESSSLQMIVDSGSSLIMLPFDILEELTQNCQVIGVSLRCPCPTHDLSVFPTMEFTIGETTLTLEPEYYVQTYPESAVCNLLVSAFQTYYEKLIILGNPFMRKYYTIFDRPNHRVGIVKSLNVLPRQSRNPIHIYILTVLACFLLATGIIKLVNHKMDNYIKQFDLIDKKDQKNNNYRLV